MGGHDAPESWLDRWREQEPVRLYLWTVASTVLAGCAVAGWLTQELALAVTGPVAALLMVGGTAAARGQAFAPATVGRLQDDWARRTDELLDEEHTASWREGWEAGADAAAKAAEETERTPDKVAAETRPHVAVAPETTAMAAADPCTYVEAPEHGPIRRCVLPQHPAAFPHRLEGVGVGE